jgi:glutamine synthetase
MKSGGIADTANVGPEVEFFIFDEVRYDQTQYCGYYYLDKFDLRSGKSVKRFEGSAIRGIRQKKNLVAEVDGPSKDTEPHGKRWVSKTFTPF